MTENNEKKFVVVPSVMELGWKVFAYGPLAHAAFLQSGSKDCVVYGNPGEAHLYPFAEYREVSLPVCEAECLGIRNPSKEVVEKMNEIAQTVVNDCKNEFGEFLIFGPPNIKKITNPSPLFLNEGKPYKIGGRYIKSLALKQGNKFKAYGNTRSIVLCIRNRKTASYRNWPFKYWKELIERCCEDKQIGKIVIIGKIEETDAWQQIVSPVCGDKIEDKTNQTTVDDCVDIISDCFLTVGGSSGMMHVASRCGCPHLVWGKASLKRRYQITNIFDANMMMLPVGWYPQPETICEQIKDYVYSERFIT